MLLISSSVKREENEEPLKIKKIIGVTSPTRPSFARRHHNTKHQKERAQKRGRLYPTMAPPFWWIASTLALIFVSVHGNPSWTVYHSWNGGKDYSRRGTLQWNGEELEVENDADLTKADMEAMLQSGWYHVKIDTVGGEYVLATVPACNVRRANFRDEFSVLLPRAGDPQALLSLAYTPLVSPLAPKSCADLEISETSKWNSRAQVSLETPGMSIQSVLPNTKPPPGLTFLKNPNAMHHKKAAAAKGPNAGTGAAAA